MNARPAPLGALEISSIGAAGLSLLSFGLIALTPLALGKELECFPHLRTALGWVVTAGVLGFLLAALLGLGLAATVAARKAPPSFARLGGLAGAVLVFTLVATPPFGDGIRYLFGMSSSHFGPSCRPAGWLGRDPQAWEDFSRAMGYQRVHWDPDSPY